MHRCRLHLLLLLLLLYLHLHLHLHLHLLPLNQEIHYQVVVPPALELTSQVQVLTKHQSQLLLEGLPVASSPLLQHLHQQRRHLILEPQHHMMLQVTHLTLPGKV
jgi:hypothetical protein